MRALKQRAHKEVGTDFAERTEAKNVRESAPRLHGLRPFLLGTQTAALSAVRHAPNQKTRPGEIQ
jgi:hypothetical protein